MLISFKLSLPMRSLKLSVLNGLLVAAMYCGAASVFASEFQNCVDSGTEYIVGGGASQAAKDALPHSKCLVSTSNTLEKPKASKSLKFEKSLRTDRDVSTAALKVNLYDKRTVEDRNLILNAELRKAQSLKENLSHKKSNGQVVDELELKRLDADIKALKNELSR
jgi:hypothetical protein